ncbi:histidinol-phosphate aminotransferase [Cyclonatronum proteinivorum]|uniref:Histidinol-phosphate aminotransferase n=1 Tax=Cyclonatronum proteinivorum TaxID=1457365 RepID=A0A345UMB1_9BACT|nr:histidinol-phosphate transaminase [Cyclonatronum proteinivorum]AXJ01613.1 histidinol-phosphate aminotransferase [Cyclonatronum proteinivorum]
MSAFDTLPLLRPNIRSLKPYRSARDDFKTGILLDANENPFAPEQHPEARLNRYPDPHFEALRARLSELKDVKPSQIFLGNGSDEAIDILIRMFCQSGEDTMVITPPTYGMYKVSADIQGIQTVEAPLNPDFSLDPEGVIEAVKTSGAKLVFLCSPNNPTANRLDAAHIRQVLEAVPALVIVDEAYIDFSAGESALRWLGEFPNLVVMQTLSKAWGLAGIRLGMAFASETIISYMMRVKPPYNVNTLTQQTALAALASPERTSGLIAQILAERERLAEALLKFPAVYKVEPSDANFLLVRVKDAPGWYKALAAEEVIVRYRGDQLHCTDGLRVTIGTPEENDRLLAAFEKLSAIVSPTT